MFALKLSLFISLSVVNAVNFAPFMTNGDDALIAEFPFLVSIQEVNVIIGAGSLLNEKWILSSARFFAGKRLSNLNIEYGNTIVTPGPTAENNAGIAQLILHENFGVPLPASNDISLIESDKSIFIGLHQPFAKLAIPGGFRFSSGTEGVFPGWGHVSLNTRNVKLQKANLKILSHEECTEAVGDAQKPTSQNICAIGESVMCTGDLGGPLLVNGVVVGVGSFRGGPNCESVEGKFPNVYLSVSYYVSSFI